MSRKKKTIKFGYFLAELLILILGISVSFFLNEWRINNQERNKERDLLKSFKQNLISDSTILHYGAIQLDSQVVYAQRVIAFNGDLPNDQIYKDVISLLNYVPFNSNDITYQEMKSVGSSRLIEDDSLLADIIGLYENNFEMISTWVGIDGGHVRDRLIPYVENNFPFVPSLNYLAADNNIRGNFLDEVRADNFKHLVQFGMSYKATESSVFRAVLTNIKKVILKIDKELAIASSLQTEADQENTSQDPQ